MSDLFHVSCLCMILYVGQTSCTGCMPAASYRIEVKLKAESLCSSELECHVQQRLDTYVDDMWLDGIPSVDGLSRTSSDYSCVLGDFVMTSVEFTDVSCLIACATY